MEQILNSKEYINLLFIIGLYFMHNINTDKINVLENNQDTKPKEIKKSVVLIKRIIEKFATGEHILYTVICETGKHLGVFDTLKACKHFAIRHEYRYEFVH